jgi:hypothetical protein
MLDSLWAKTILTGGIVMKSSVFLSLLLFVTSLVAAATAQAAVLGYPSTENASFLVDLPDGWEVEPGEAEGDYVHVNSPSGVYLAFRTIAASESAMKDAIEESVAYLNENYKEVKVSDPVDAKQADLTGFYMDGTGKDADGASVTFRMAWLALSDKLVGEIWFAAPADDKAGIAAAAKTLSSFRTP